MTYLKMAAKDDRLKDEERPLLDTIASTKSASLLRNSVWLNAMSLNACVFLTYTGFDGILVLQSSLHVEGGLGAGALALLCLFGIVGSFASAALVRRLGSKWTLVLSVAAMLPYVAANFHATWWTFAPSAALAGAATGATNVAQRTYLARLATHYAQAMRADADRVQSRLFAANTVFYKLSAVLGNLASALILGGGSGEEKIYTNISDLDLLMCGARHCNDVAEEPGESLTSPVDPNRLGHLLWFSLGVGALAVALGAAVLSPLSRMGIADEAKTDGGGDTLGALRATWSQMRNPRVCLLVPMFVALSGCDSFWTADFVKAYVSCSLGLENVGFVMMWDGVSGSLSCLLFGWFNSRRYRSALLLLALITQVGVVIFLFFFTPSRDSWMALSILTATWSMGSGIKTALLPALVASVFPAEVMLIYPIMYTWFFIGGAVFFALSALLCMTAKLFVMLSLLLLCALGYITLEVILVRAARSQHHTTDNNHYLSLVDDKDCDSNNTIILRK